MSKFALLFLLTYASGIVAALSLGPAWGFYLYELVYWLNPGNRWWGNDIPGFRYSFFSVAVMGAAFLIYRKQHMKNLISDMPEFKWFIAMMLCYVLVTFIAVDEYNHNRFLMFHINLYITIFIAYRVLDSENKLGLALLFYMLGGAYIGYEAMNAGRDAFGRVEGIGTVDSPDNNTLAASLVPIIPLVLYYAWQGSMKVKAVAGLCGLFTVNAIVLINSRGAFLGAAAAFGYFLVYMMFSKFKMPKQRMIIVILMIASILVVIRLFDNTFWDRMATLQEQSIESDGSGARRVNFWLASLDMLEDYPFGAGVYGFETLSSNYLHDESYFQTESQGRMVRAVHSIWFQTLTEIGWIGFATFIMLLYSTYKHAQTAKRLLIKKMMYKQYYLIIALEAGMLGYLLSSSVINTLRIQMTFWMLLFLVCASVIFCKVKGEEEGVEVVDRHPHRRGIF
jgi:hypothetical protein